LAQGARRAQDLRSPLGHSAGGPSRSEMAPQPPTVLISQQQSRPQQSLYKYNEGGKRPRSVRVESFRPLHQSCFHEQPRTGASSSSQASGRSQSASSLPGAIDYGKAIRTLWDLQGSEFRKPQETAACVAPGITALHLSRSTSLPSTAPGLIRAPAKSQEKRCEEVLGALVCDSDHWGKVQERQARLIDDNRDLSRRSEVLRRDTIRDNKARNNLLSQTFGASSQDMMRSKSSTYMHSQMMRSKSPTGGSVQSSLSPPWQTSTDHAYGAENAWPSQRMRALAKEKQGHEKTRAFTLWGANAAGVRIGF